MNFGDLLFALNCDRLKNDIRKIEKINKRIVQSKNGIYFNEIYIYDCLQNYDNVTRYYYMHFTILLHVIYCMYFHCMYS